MIKLGIDMDKLMLDKLSSSQKISIMKLYMMKLNILSLEDKFNSEIVVIIVLAADLLNFTTDIHEDS